MIEIVVGVWLTCFLLSLITVGINYNLTRKKLASQTLKTLNVNLEKVGLFWSNSSSDFLPLTPDAIQVDASKALNSTLYLAALGLISLPGFLLLLIIVFSIHILARSRKEKATFRSPLVHDPNLLRAEVDKLVQEYQQIN